jgi:hypothetical protein
MLPLTRCKSCYLPAILPSAGPRTYSNNSNKCLHLLLHVLRSLVRTLGADGKVISGGMAVVHAAQDLPVGTWTSVAYR